MPVSLSDQPTQKTKAFRHDINGLRAWAVIAVVLYHFGIPGFTGGFIGVDVFFVISGFLMTSIIIEGLERGTFSLWGFYLARARRIIPALLVLCISLLILGWFWLPSVDYKMLGTHAATALAFVSNLKFWREAGYFDAASHEKWLLHTWSLSVEWQFYILLPLGCLLLWHWLGRTAVKWALVAAGLLSLLLSVYASARWPGAAFYLLPTRAWEMLAGGLVWWSTRTQPMPRKMAMLAEVVGFALIIISIFCFAPAMQWPGYLALVPVLGAMCVLAANRSNSWLTANLIARRLGASSYSIYLWHWPFVVLLTYASETANPQWIAAGISLSVLLGELSLRWVENPTRKGLTKLSLTWQPLVLGGAMVIAAMMAVGARYQQVEGRIDPVIELASSEKENRAPRTSECFLEVGQGSISPLCQFGSGELRAVVIGDSHANANVSSVVESAGGSIIEIGYSGCSTILGLNRTNDIDDGCKKFNTRAVNLANNEYKDLNIIIINRSGFSLYGPNEEGPDRGMPYAYFDIKYSKNNSKLNESFKTKLIETACSFKNPSRVYLVRPIPEMGVDVPNAILRPMMFGKPTPQISISLEEYHQRHDFVWESQDEAARQCGVKILDPLPYLCHDGRCWGSKDGRPLYFDDDHLSEFGNKLLVPMFKQAFAGN
jgi:peptidoglycan/LPS O-acetylase OafA/YrhL